MLPLPRTRNRFAAPLFVFIFGMIFLKYQFTLQQVMEPFHPLNLKTTVLLKTFVQLLQLLREQISASVGKRCGARNPHVQLRTFRSLCSSFTKFGLEL